MALMDGTLLSLSMVRVIPQHIQNHLLHSDKVAVGLDAGTDILL